MTVIRAISDMHGNLDFTVGPCDILIVAGDICPRGNDDVQYQADWLNTTFAEWLAAQPAQHVVATWGNHDKVGFYAPELVKLPWHMLNDQALNLLGFNFYGTPWSLPFRNLNSIFHLIEEDLAEKYAAIPDDTDILISHGPPYGFGDLAYDVVRKHVGSKALLDRIEQIKPQLTVFGHIHSGFGAYFNKHSVLLNACVVDEYYRLAAHPAVVWFDENRKFKDINVRDIIL